MGFLVIYTLVKILIRCCTSLHFSESDAQLMLGPAYQIFKEVGIMVFVLATFLAMHSFGAFPFMQQKRSVD
jgi:hypothetical protein